MEQIFKIALGMLFFVGFLQAKPTPTNTTQCSNKQQKFSFDMDNVDFGGLGNIICGDTVTFIAPTNVNDTCIIAALGVFTEELKKAGKNCTGQAGRAEPSAVGVETSYQKDPVCEHLAECTWDDQEFRKPYGDFLKTMEKFLQKLNSMSP